MPKKPASKLDGRKEFFDHASQQGKRNSSEDPDIPISRRKRGASPLAEPAPSAKAPDVSRAMARTSSKQSSADRPRSGSRGRSPAVLPSDKSPDAKPRNQATVAPNLAQASPDIPIVVDVAKAGQKRPSESSAKGKSSASRVTKFPAQPVAPTSPAQPVTPTSAADHAKPLNDLEERKRDGKKRERSSSAPKAARKDSTSTAAPLSRALNAEADSFVPIRDRIPVHLAADCEWTDDQVLAADAKKRRAHARAHRPLRSPGADFSEVELRALATGQLPVDLQAPAPVHANPEAPPGNPKRRRGPQQHYDKPKPSKATISVAETAPTPISKRPKVLWSRAVEEAAANPPAAAIPRVISIKHLGKYYSKHHGDQSTPPVKVNQAYFDAAPLDQRHLLKVVHTSDSDSTESSHVNFSSGSSDQSDDDDNDQPGGGSPTNHQQSGAQPGIDQRPARSSQRPAPPPPPPPNPPQSGNRAVESLTVLVVKLAAVDGSCLFDSTARALRHILRLDLGAFNAANQRSAEIAIMALTDPDVVRKQTCAHLLGPFADIPCASLQMLTPRQSVQADYINGGEPLFDFDWVPPPGVLPAPVAQTISSYEQYVSAMSKKRACGDEICLAAIADLLGLRVVVFDVRGAAVEDSDWGRYVTLSLDHHPDFSTLQERRLMPRPPTGEPLRILSSKMPIILLRQGPHFDWMHPESDDWGSDEPVEPAEVVLGSTAVEIHEIFNPDKLISPRPDYLPRRPTSDLVARPPPCASIMLAEKHRRQRSEVIAHLIGEGMPEVQIMAIIALYESGGINHVSLQKSLPAIERIRAALDKHQTIDPLSAGALHGHLSGFCDADTGHHPPPQHRTTSPGSYSKIMNPSGRRFVPCAGPTLCLPPQDMGTFKPRAAFPKAPPPSRWESELQHAIEALMIVGNISRQAASAIMQRHADAHGDVSPMGAALRSAHQELKASKESRKAAAAAYVPLQSSERADHILSASRAEFISKYLGNDSRAMTATEISLASKNQRREEYTGAPAEPIPLNLTKYWAHHQHATMTTPRGPMNIPRYLQRIHRMSCDALHREACEAASAKRRRLDNEWPQPAALIHPLAQQTAPTHLPAQQAAQMHPHGALAQPDAQQTLIAADRGPRQLAPIYAPDSPMYAAPERDPGPYTWRDREMPGGVPESALRPAVLFSLQQPQQPAHEPPAPPLEPQAPLPIPLRAETMQPQVAAQPIQPPSAQHASPAVRLACNREERIARADNTASPAIRITVDTGMLPANSVIWKKGEEKDGAGFNYHAFSGVKTSWEQSNSDSSKSYHTFKSFIDARFIGVICDNTDITRLTWESTSDAELLRKLEEKLKPKDATVYFVKVGSIKISQDPKDGSLSKRYGAFAEAFLSAVNEAREAGTPVQDEAVKFAFKVACNSNRLLQMWLGAERWTTVQAAHQRIFKELQSFEALQLCETLSKAPTGAAAAGAAADPLAAPAAAQHAPAVQQAPAIPPVPQQPPRQQFTPEQRREHYLQQQQLKFQQQQQQLLAQQQQQQHQEAVIANAVQRSVNTAWQQRMEQAPPLTQSVAAPAIVNVMETPRMRYPNAAPFTLPGQPHSGLDARGPNWHAAGPHLHCHYSPCTSTFCQGCGNHGHSSADCRRRNHPEWNASGYFSDRYPGKSGLQYVSNQRTNQSPQAAQAAFPQQPQFAQPPPMQQQPMHHQQQFGQQQQMQQMPPPAQPKIAPPPMPPPMSPPFPTPHRMNNVSRSAPQASMSMQANASTQFGADVPPAKSS